VVVAVKQLDQLRHRIDALDTRLLSLLSQRGKLAIQIGHLKNSRGGGVYVPHREEMILRRLTTHNRGPLPDAAVRSIFREIISSCRMLEQHLRVAYFQGTNSTLTRIARVGFGSGARCEPMTSIADVFHTVSAGKADIGLVPVENSDEGSVSDTLDLFIQSDLQICAEWTGASTFTLCSRIPLGKTRKVWGKADAVAACREWIRRILPAATCRKVDHLRDALEHASQDADGALVADIQDDVPKELRLRTAAFHESQTRYWVLGKTDTLPTGHDKTSLMFILADEVGALQKSIAALSGAGINITRIESRPSHRKSDEFNFFVDVAGHLREPKVARAVSRLRKKTQLVKVLGSYPVVDGGIKTS
jgi:chorismate mutase/prephenate dehydratase